MELVKNQIVKAATADAKYVQQILVIGRNKRQISKNSFEFFVKKYYVCYTAEKNPD